MSRSNENDCPTFLYQYVVLLHSPLIVVREFSGSNDVVAYVVTCVTRPVCIHRGRGIDNVQGKLWDIALQRPMRIYCLSYNDYRVAKVLLVIQ
jgi:hypothetical protein